MSIIIIIIIIIIVVVVTIIIIPQQSSRVMHAKADILATDSSKQKLKIDTRVSQ